MNNLPKVAAHQHRYRDSNLRPSDRKSDALPLGYHDTPINFSHDYDHESSPSATDMPNQEYQVHFAMSVMQMFYLIKYKYHIY